MKHLFLISATLLLLGAGCARAENPYAAAPRRDASPQQVARVRTCADYEASLGRVPSYDSVRNEDAKKVENIAGKEIVKKTFDSLTEAARQFKPGTDLGLQPPNFPIPSTAKLCGTNEPLKTVVYSVAMTSKEARAFFERELPAHGFPISSVADEGSGLPRGIIVIYFSEGGITISDYIDIVSIMFVKL